MDCIPVIDHLRSEFKGSLLAYSVEVDETNMGIPGNALHSRVVEEMIRGIDAAGDHEDSLSTTADRSTWVAIKLVRFNGHRSFDAHPKPLRQPSFPTLTHWSGFLNIWSYPDPPPLSHSLEVQRLEIWIP